MPNWSDSMQQTFEYYKVNPNTWLDESPIDDIKSSSITRDADSETRGSASFELSKSIGECYVRTYLVTIQNGITERTVLGTHLVQSPSGTFDGKEHSYSIDGYTPLIELKEKLPPFGYTIMKDTPIMARARSLIFENARAPVQGVIEAGTPATLFKNFTADPTDTWLSFVTDLAANAKYTIDVNELGRIGFAPEQDINALQPIWQYNDDNSSILYADVTLEEDLYGIPNVVEIVCQKPSGSGYFYSRVVNDDPNSPVSTISRGREIVKRFTEVNIPGALSQAQVDEYAVNTLRQISTLEGKINYQHGYCPVRVGDGVLINYEKAGLNNIRAKVIRQSISCTPGTPVSETAVFIRKLWR